VFLNALLPFRWLLGLVRCALLVAFLLAYILFVGIFANFLVSSHTKARSLFLTNQETHWPTIQTYSLCFHGIYLTSNSIYPGYWLGRNPDRQSDKNVRVALQQSCNILNQHTDEARLKAGGIPPQEML
jgi:hypothetical protein